MRALEEPFGAPIGDERVFFDSPVIIETLPGDIPAEEMDILIGEFIYRTQNPDITPWGYVQAAEILAGECDWGVDALTGRPQYDLPRLNDDQLEELLATTVRLAEDTRSREFALDVQRFMYRPHIATARNILRFVEDS